jgi:hypothetical protein
LTDWKLVDMPKLMTCAANKGWGGRRNEREEKRQAQWEWCEPVHGHEGRTSGGAYDEEKTTKKNVSAWGIVPILIDARRTMAIRSSGINLCEMLVSALGPIAAGYSVQLFSPSETQVMWPEVRALGLV